MPHLFTCPHCQTRTQVDDKYSGQKGECVTCGGEIQLPMFAQGIQVTAPFRRRADGKRPMGVYVAAGAVIFVLTCVLFAAVKYGGQTITTLAQNRARASSMKNLEKIASALNDYANDFGTYPPPYTTGGPNNRPMHSWRVLLLPYLDEVELYDQFDLSLPWDHQINLTAAYRMPPIFEHPDVSSGGYSMRSAYFYITGPQTLFPKGKPLGPGDVTDDGSQTILVIEAQPTAASGMWTEPVDLDFTKMKGIVGGTVGIEPGGWIEGGAAMATIDGRAHFLPDGTAPSTFNALVTPQGNEPLADDTLD